MDFISILRKYLPRFKKVLELSSNKGENLQALHEYYEVTASEENKIKTRYLKDEFIDIRVIVLDNLTCDSHKRVDCVFSKGVFENYSKEQIKESLKNQKNLLNEGGYIFHISKDISLYEEIFLEDYEILEKDKNFILAKILN